MTTEQKQLTDVLNDLIRINYDRVRGYQTAHEEAEENDVDLRILFSEKSAQSKEFILDLERMVAQNGGDIVTDSTLSGKLYRVWMDFKAAVTGHDRKSLLESCVFGEKAALEAYEDAMASSAEIPAEIRQTIAEQKSKIQGAMETVQAFAKLHDVVS